jgi:predicted PurR-regulated permease PerM
MKALNNQAIFIFVTVICITLLYLLSPILTPFMLGALLAYLVNPVVKFMEKWRVPHLLSVTIVFILLFSTGIIAVALLYPLVMRQIEVFLDSLPQMLDWAQNVGVPWLMQFINIETLKSSLRSSLPATLSKTEWVLRTFLTSSFAAIQTIVSLVLTPVVTFYFLRDWDKMLAGIKSLLPGHSASAIIQLASDCDEVLSAFIRGQLLVMLFLSIIYATGLSLIGLKFGLIIGLIGGLLSLVPYLGSTFIIVAASLAAFMQSGKEALLPVLIVYLIGQVIEGYVLTPYLVGGRIGLHPVAVIFSVMAGGALFGFFGVLLALPVAAILMATFRFFKARKLI